MIRALTTVLRDNLRHETSDLGLPAKCLSGLVYATVVQNQPLAAAAQQLTAHLAPTIDAKVLDQVAQFAAQPAGDDQAALQQVIAALSSLPTLSEQTAAALLLAQAAAPSPANISPALLLVVSPHLAPSAMVELIIWLSIQQLLHRLSCFYAVANRGEAMP